MLTILSLLDGGIIPLLSVGVTAPSGYCRVFPNDILKLYQSFNKALGREIAHYHFHFLADFRQENQKLKELVTGGATAAGSSAAPSDTEATEAKEEPVKEESAAVRPKMEATTPQKVVKSPLKFFLFFFILQPCFI